MTTGDTVHASAVQVGPFGVLIRGSSGSGKSSLTLALLHADVSNNRLIADDRVLLDNDGGFLLATVPAELAGLLEVRGVGIVRRRHVSPARVHLVVDLSPADQCPRMPEPAERVAEVAGLAVPRLMLPIGGAASDGALRIFAALQDGLLQTP
jgi:serine kinase of HPr protein (carbohydrate metabolism regulator)